ncbi:MAG: M55 family metallopeptidase [Trebonia sp.]
MRVYISADMEGVTGLVDAQDVQPAGRDYEWGRVMMTGDVNAAVRGAFAAGASDVLVNDAHGPMRNLLHDQLDPHARLIKGGGKRMGMLEGLDVGFDAVLCVGYHSRAGALGVMSHSFMGHEIEDMWLDGRPVGEIGMVHAASAAIGVPVLMLTGDDAACGEVEEWDGGVASVAVKSTRHRFAAELVPAAAARQMIESAAEGAIADCAGRRRPPTRVPDPVTLAVRWQSATVAAHLQGIPGVRARDSRTVEATGHMADLWPLFGVFMRVASSLTGNQPYC